MDVTVLYLASRSHKRFLPNQSSNVYAQHNVESSLVAIDPYCWWVSVSSSGPLQVQAAFEVGRNLRSFRYFHLAVDNICRAFRTIKLFVWFVWWVYLCSHDCLKRKHGIIRLCVNQRRNKTSVAGDVNISSGSGTTKTFKTRF